MFFIPLPQIFCLSYITTMISLKDVYIKHLLLSINSLEYLHRMNNSIYNSVCNKDHPAVLRDSIQLSYVRHIFWQSEKCVKALYRSTSYFQERYSLCGPQYLVRCFGRSKCTRFEVNLMREIYLSDVFLDGFVGLMRRKFLFFVVV